MKSYRLLVFFSYRTIFISFILSIKKLVQEHSSITLKEREMSSIIQQVSDLAKMDLPAEENHVLRGLPAPAYTSEEFFKEEQKRIFQSNWVLAGFVHELKEPGTAIPTEVGGQPILLLTDDKGEIGVFHNLCRHRGLILVTEKTKVEQSITCPYHAWSYDTSGALESAPHFGGFRKQEVPGFKKCDFGLLPVRFAIWHDWVFVNIDGKAPEFNEYVATFEEELKDFDFGTLEPIGRIDLGEVQANWKLLMENFIEPYHVPVVHDVTAAGQPLKDHYTITNGRLLGSAVDLEVPKQDSEVADHLDMSARYLTLFPSFVLGIYLPDQAGVHINMPVSAGVTHQYRVLYSLDQREYTEEEKKALCDLWTDVHKEDHEIAVLLQKGRHSVAMNDGGLMSPHWEDSAQAFQRMVLENMQKNTD